MQDGDNSVVGHCFPDTCPQQALQSHVTQWRTERRMVPHCQSGANCKQCMAPPIQSHQTTSWSKYATASTSNDNGENENYWHRKLGLYSGAVRLV